LEDYLGSDDSFEIIIVNQTDDLPFNRAFLFNVGVWNVSKQSDYLVLQDLDLLPFDFFNYSFPEINTPVPLTKFLCHYNQRFYCQPRLYAENVGGVLKLSRNLYERINGMSNLFWGWGGEGINFFFFFFF